MTMEFIWSPFIVGSIANTSLSDCHHESSHLISGTKHNLSSNCTRQGLARSDPSYSHSLRYWRRLFQLPMMTTRAATTAFWQLLLADIVP